jgi:hypothetical protein
MGMSQEIHANYAQMDLLLQCLDDWVARDTRIINDVWQRRGRRPVLQNPW